MAYDERTNEPVREREREIIVTDRGDRGSSIGGVIAAIIGVIVIGLIAYMLIVGFGGSESDSLNVEMPDEVNVDTGGGGGGDTGNGG